MKLYLIGTLAALLITGTVRAQHNNIGVKAGLNYYTLSGQNNTNLDSKPGIHLGLLSHIHLTDPFALQPEIVFSMQGAQSSNGDTKLNLNYVNIPVLFQYMFDNGFRIQAGPQLGFMVSADSKTGNTSTDVKDGFKGIDLGLALGASYIHPPTGFGVDGRYNIGASNINESGSENTYNRGLQLGVFYLFNHRSGK